MYPGLQTPQEHWSHRVGSGESGTLLDAILHIIISLRVINFPVTPVGQFLESQGLVKTLLLVCPHLYLSFYLSWFDYLIRAHGGARRKELTELWDKVRQPE